MLILHHLNQSRSSRILWALEELQLTYEIRNYQRLANLAAPPELKQIHPLGKAPILQDGQRVIAESAVILEYLQGIYDTKHQFKPVEAESALNYSYWMHYAEGSLMPLLVFQLVTQQVELKAPFLFKPVAKQVTRAIQQQFIQPRLKEHVDYLEQYLSQNEYFASDFSFADIQMSFPLLAITSRVKGNFPHIQAFLARISNREAYSIAKHKQGS